MQLTPNFSLREATYSAAAETHKIKNIPGPEELERIKRTAIGMEGVRQLLGNLPIKITSWYRGPEVNKLVAGAPSSQHCKGEAVDFKCLAYGSPRQICRFLQENKEVIQYDQLILEPTWVHISFTLGAPRGNELTYLAPGHYTKGIS